MTPSSQQLESPVNPGRFNFEAIVDIETGEVIAGELPKRALSLVLEWRNTHIPELKENWELAREHKELKKIPPLE